jgi:hypothetical protein
MCVKQQELSSAVRKKWLLPPRRSVLQSRGSPPLSYDTDTGGMIGTLREAVSGRYAYVVSIVVGIVKVQNKVRFVPEIFTEKDTAAQHLIMAAKILKG